MKTGAFTPSLKTVVSEYKKLKVEDYQRTYSWQKEQIDEFFSDLKDCSLSRENTHFFGALILQDKEDEVGTATVVDGQQRLTTAFIFVSALRDSIADLGKEVIVPDKTDLMPINVKQKAWDFLYASNSFIDHRFVPNRFLAELMKNCVFAEPNNQLPIPPRDQHVTLAFRKGVKQIRDLVKKDLLSFPDDDAKLARINRLLDTLFDQFIVLRVTTASLNESLEIFLTLNNRGLPLGPSDLVRGQVMKNLGRSLNEPEQLTLQKKILEEWEAIAENVIEPEAFLRHYLVSTSESKVQKKKVVDAVEKRINDPAPSIQFKNTQDFWEDLISASTVYAQVLAPSMGGETQFQIELLEKLIRSHRIILMTLFKSQIDEINRNEIVRLVFVLSYRWVMAGKNAQKLEDFFQIQSASIRDGRSPESIIESLRDEILNTHVDPYVFFSADADSSFISRALLHSVDRLTTQGANVLLLDSKKLHLEHIAPQSPTPDWIEYLFEGDQTKYSNYENVITSIGNLTLLDNGLNLRAQRSPFAEKQALYKASRLDIARDLQGFSKWTESLVDKRTKWLSEMFQIIWSVEPTKEKVVRFSDWYH